MFFTKNIFINQERSKLMSQPTKVKSPKNCHVCGSAKHVVKHCVLKDRYNSLMDMYMMKMEKWVNTLLENEESNFHMYELPEITYAEKNFLKFGVWFMQNKKEGMRITTGSYIYADEMKQNKHKNGLVENFYSCYNNIGKKYFDKRKNEKKEVEKQCSICLEELEGKPTCTTLCNHTFCSSCFHSHVGRSYGRGNGGYNCPLCRAINN